MNMIRVLKKADTDYIEKEWGSLRWVANGKLGNSEHMTVGRVIIKKGCFNPQHAHPNCEEVLYLLKGILEHTFGDERAVLEPGDTITISQGISHNAVNTGNEDAEMIVVYSFPSREVTSERQPSEAGSNE